MKTYELQILRYYHDIITGEFVNVGIILFNKEENYLDCAVTHKYGRISKFFHAEKTSFFVSQTIRSFENGIQRISYDLQSPLDFNEFPSIEAITNRVMPKDDGSLQCSEIIRGLSLDLNKTFYELFTRYVTQYETVPQKTSRTDEEAWSQVYKKYFDEYGITKKLTSHDVKTENTTIHFDLSVQNGALHLYNPVSFDLVEADSVQDKVYRWRGKISEIETTNEDIAIHMLLLYPDNSSSKEKESINKQLLSSATKKNLTLYTENELKMHLAELNNYFTEEEESVF